MSKGTPEQIRQAAIELENATKAIQETLDKGEWPTQEDSARAQAASKRHTELSTGKPLRR